MSSAASRQPMPDNQDDTAAVPPLRVVSGPDPWLSPSIESEGSSDQQAYELKFLVSEPVASEIQQWAQLNLQPDAFADPANNFSYQTTSLYLDTPAWDVLHRSPGFRRRKYRVRRYGDSESIFLERKSRRGDRVRKRRSSALTGDLARLADDAADDDWSGAWFQHWVDRRGLRPACRLTYRRTAFVGWGPTGTIRLTLDRQIRGALSSDWNLDPVADGVELLAGQVVCEFKFRQTLPLPLKRLQSELRLTTASVSKYRRFLASAGLTENPRNA